MTYLKFSLIPLTIFGCLITFFARVDSIALGQIDDDPFGAPVQPATQEPAAKKTPSDAPPKSEEGNSPNIEIPAEELPATFMRMHLNDGDIVSGELANKTISIVTDFGTLAVPIAKIVRFEPGLNSFPQIIAKLDSLVEQLGSTKYDEREIAHKKLMQYGIKIKNELARYDGETNAERKRHLGEIKKEIEAMIESMDDEDDEEQVWERNDKLVMANFTAVGKIQETEFELNGKYGQLKIALQDIRKGTRPVGNREAIEKSVTVNKDHFVQFKFKSAGVTVEKGDSISVTSSGSLALTPWGGNVSSTADGMPQYGVMPNTPGIPYGALVARIGNSGKYFLVGQKKKFRADAKGKLQFGITMRASYVGKTYQFPGEYKVKIKIEPGE